MSIKYKLVIYWSEIDNCFVVEVPELSVRMYGRRKHISRSSK